MTTSERPSALLTPSQREVISGDPEISARGERSARARIRERVYHGLWDGGRLVSLSADDREKIFTFWERADDWREAESDSDRPAHFNSRAVSREEWLFQMQLENLLQFLYIGIEESTKWDFSELLKTAINQAEAARNREVQAYTFDIETQEREDLEELHTRFEAGDSSLDTFHIKSLKREGLISDEDLGKYFEQLSSDES